MSTPRASLSDVTYYRVFLPYLVRLGPPWFRRKLLDLIPSARIQRFKLLIDVAHAGCRRVFEEKKAALARGDQELLHTVGEGKDIMSVLRKFRSGFDVLELLLSWRSQ